MFLPSAPVDNTWERIFSRYDFKKNARHNSVPVATTIEYRAASLATKHSTTPTLALKCLVENGAFLPIHFESR